MSAVEERAIDAAAMNKPRCVPWDGRYREGVLRLFEDVSFKDALWHWQFESNPFSLPFRPVVLVDESDQVVGFNGVMAAHATDHGDDISVLWSCDFYLAAEWRGRGLGSDIKHELHSRAPVIMAFGISDQAANVLRHLGWVPHETVRTYRMLRRRKGLRSVLLRSLQYFNRLVGRFSRGVASDGMQLEVRSALPGREEVDALWQRCFRDYGRVVTRNFSYLDWRYQKHPLARYGFVCAWQGQGADLAAVLVTRFSRGSLRIVDYCGPVKSLPLKRSLIKKAVIHWPHANQVNSVTSDPELAEAFLSEGFIQLRDRPRFYVYEGDSRQSRCQSQWFIMAGDSDGEFLQAANDFCSIDSRSVLVSERAP